MNSFGINMCIVFISLGNYLYMCHGIALPHLCAPVVLLRPSGLSYAHL